MNITPNFPLRRRRASCPAPAAVAAANDVAPGCFTLEAAEPVFFHGKPKGWLKRNWSKFNGGFFKADGTVWFHPPSFVAKNF